MSLATVIYYLPLFVAAFIMIMFSMISAYVLRFRVAKGGLGFDYVIFTMLIVLALKLGGAI